MFEKKDMSRLGRAVRATEKIQHLSAQEQYRRGQPGDFLAQTTDYNGTAYSWTKYYLVSGVPTVWPGSSPPTGVYNAYHRNPPQNPIVNGTNILMRFEGNDGSGNPTYSFDTFQLPLLGTYQGFYGLGGIIVADYIRAI